MIRPNEQVVEKRKNPKPSEEQEPIGKHNVLGYQIQKDTLDAPLYAIPPNEQVVEERKPSNSIIPKVPSKEKPNKLSPKVALMVNHMHKVPKS